MSESKSRGSPFLIPGWLFVRILDRDFRITPNSIHAWGDQRHRASRMFWRELVVSSDRF